MNRFVFIGGDTIRSRIYLNFLERANLLPCYAIVLESETTQILPGQISGEQFNSLPVSYGGHEIYFDNLNLSLHSKIESLNIPCEVLPTANINDSLVVEAISRRSEELFIYSGFGGAILEDQVLSMPNKKYLHIHGGYLPTYKGSTTNYYSLLNDNAMGASSIFLTSEIDCGPILLRKCFPPPKDKTQIDYVYDSVVRGIVLIETLQALCGKRNLEAEFNAKEKSQGDHYYIIHPVLKHIAIMGNLNQASECA